MKAIISDIHSNLEALEAVLEDIESRKITEIFCLGDIIGYGPDPMECLELMRKHSSIVIKGNHEEAALSAPIDFNAKAASAILWTRECIDEAPPGDSRASLEFLEGLAEKHTDNGILMVHGSPRQPTRDYLFPREIHDAARMQELFGMIDHYCFLGHTHIPGVFTQDGTYDHPNNMTMKGIYLLDEQKAMINVGSVGQPRDGDTRACYCTFDGDSVVFRRVAYDVQTTVRKIYANRRLDNALGDRLKEGR